MFCYIDPGTGSMLFTIIIGIVTALVFSLKKLLLKIKFVITGGKVAQSSADKLPFVIFSDSKRYWNVFKPICDEFEKRKQNCYYWTSSPDDPALNESYEYIKCEFIGEGNKAFVKMNTMKAVICLSTTPGLDVYQWKRSKDTDFNVHTLHEVGGVVGYRMFGLDYYDAVLLSGAYQEENIREIEYKRNIPKKETYVVGSTYMDAMYSRLADTEKISNKVPVVLVAPSWGASSILNRFGEKFLESLEKTGYQIIVRPHPQSRTSDPELLEKLQMKFTNVQWNYDNDNFDVLNKSDILISDFSGVIFDYTLIFNKPMIFADTKVDNSPYDAAWLDKTEWRHEVLPKIGHKLEEKDFDNMKTVIDAALKSKSMDRERQIARDTSWQFRGQCAVRTVDYLVSKYKEVIGK